MSFCVFWFASIKCSGGGAFGGCGREKKSDRGPADLALVPGCPCNTMTGTSDSRFRCCLCAPSSGGVDGAKTSGGVDGATNSGGVDRAPRSGCLLRQGACASSVTTGGDATTGGTGVDEAEGGGTTAGRGVKGGTTDGGTTPPRFTKGGTTWGTAGRVGAGPGHFGALR